MNKKLLNFLVLLLLSIEAVTQPCPQFPADCPDQGTIEIARDKASSLQDFVIEEEITMQDSLRVLLTNMMKAVGELNNWRWYEYSETTGSGIGTDNNTRPLPYRFRPPHAYTISFIFIVNEDSLKAWQDWWNNSLSSAAEKVVQSSLQSPDDFSQEAAFKKYLDSANFYG